MTVNDFKGVFTAKQLETVENNLNSYLANFGYINI